MAGVHRGGGRLSRATRKTSDCFMCATIKAKCVPLSALTTIEATAWAGIHDALQRISCRADQRSGSAGLQRGSGHGGAGRSVYANHAARDGLRLHRACRFRSRRRSKACRRRLIFALSLLFVFLILAALYESWSLPFSVLLSTPVAIFGAFGILWLRRALLQVFSARRT